MKLDKDEMLELANMVAEIIASKAVSDADKKVLWSVYDIETACGYKKDSAAVRRWMADKTFPAPVSRVGHRRWFKAEILDWLKQQRNDSNLIALSMGL